MQIGAKLLLAFIAIILIMMVGNAGYTLYLDYKTTRDAAAMRCAKAMQKISESESGDLHQILGANLELGQALIHDSSILTPFLTHDRAKLAAAIKAFIGKTSFNGFCTFIDEKGDVFYSTDSPSKFGYSARKNSAVSIVLSQGKIYQGAASLTPTDSLTLSAIAPIMTPHGSVGVLAVNTPINTEFLTGLVEKLSVSSDHISNIDMAMLSGTDGTLVAVTPPLAANGGPFIQDLKDHGLRAIPNPGLKLPDWIPWLKQEQGWEAGGRWWKMLRLPGVDDKELIAVMLVTTPVPDMGGRLVTVLMLAAGCGGVALLVAMVFSAGITKSVSEPLRFLIHRTEEIANQKGNVPALEYLSGDWLELGEQIDTAVTTMRSTVQSLKHQLKTHQQEAHEKVKAADDASIQLDQMNRQFTQQSKQLTEVSKQIGAANKQAVLLQHKLDSVLQVSTEGFLVLDQFGNVLSANPVFLNWIGCSEGEIAGRLCFDLVKRPGEPPNQMNEGQAFSRHGGNPGDLINQFYPEGIIYHRSQQKAVEVIAHLQPVMSEDGGIQGHVMVLRDKSLRSEIAGLRAEIVTMLQQQIRTPLAAAEGGWQAILNNAAQTMHPSVGQPLAELHGHYEQLMGVVDSLLMMYGGFVPPPVVQRDQVIITRLVADCLEEVAPFARANQLALDYKSSSGLPAVNLNKEAVKGILVQVLERMIGVTAPGGRVRVETMLKANELRVGVQSSGPALPEHEIADMFVGFVEGRHHESTYSARLSMYLARNTVERLGGKIWAESEAGRGTIVYMGIPV